MQRPTQNSRNVPKSTIQSDLIELRRADQLKRADLPIPAGRKFTPLLNALATGLNCTEAQLTGLLDSPMQAAKVDILLRGRRIRTAYKWTGWIEDRDERCAELGDQISHQNITYTKLSTKSAHDLPAYEGFLNITVRQHFYSRHRVKLSYPYMRCVTAVLPNGHALYYPIELLEICIDPVTWPSFASFILKKDMEEKKQKAELWFPREPHLHLLCCGCGQSARTDYELCNKPNCPAPGIPLEESNEEKVVKEMGNASLADKKGK